MKEEGSINLNFGMFRPATRKVRITADSDGLEALKNALDDANSRPEGKADLTLSPRDEKDHDWTFEIRRADAIDAT